MPGTSGLLSPYAKINGLFFDPSDEPDTFYFNLLNDLKEKFKEMGVQYIMCDFENPRDYYTALTAFESLASDNIKLYGTSREGKYELVINEEADIDDPTKPSTIALQKKNRKAI